jgi:hypothetical protein
MKDEPFGEVQTLQQPRSKGPAMEDDCRRVSTLMRAGGFYRTEEKFNGVGAVPSYLNKERRTP